MTTTPDTAAVDNDWLIPAVPAARQVRRPAALEVVGELFIASGVVVALFIVWLMWWTDVTAAAEHDEIVADITWQIEPPADVAPQAPESIPEPAPPVDPTADLLTAGTTLAVLQVPKFGPDYVEPISEGVDKRTILDKLGIGHYPDSALPGQVGNFALAAHRTTYGKPFNRVAELAPGDDLIVDTADGRYVYKVTGDPYIVTPDQVEVIAPEPGKPGVDPTGRYITLTSCHPMFSARERIIVHGVLDSWTPKTPEVTS